MLPVVPHKQVRFHMLQTKKSSVSLHQKDKQCINAHENKQEHPFTRACFKIKTRLVHSLTEIQLPRSQNEVCHE